MSANTIQKSLGILQDEPDNAQAWAELHRDLGFTDEDGSVDPGDLPPEQLASLLESARRAHEARREYEAVEKLLTIEAALAAGAREAELVFELAHLRDDVLLDDDGATRAYKRLVTLEPDDAEAQDGLDRLEQRRKKWKEVAQRFFAESKEASDPAFKSSLLVSAAETAYRYGRIELEAKPAVVLPAEESSPKSVRGKKKKKVETAAAASVPTKDKSAQRATLFEKVLGLLRQATDLDPKNRRASLLLERIFREESRWEDVAKTLIAFASEAAEKEERLAALVRLARLYRKKLASSERAIAAYEQVLDLAPGHPEATSALVDWFTERSMWDQLVALYEDQLGGGGVKRGEELGVIFQIAMVNWRMREKPEAAEPYFERLRKLEPGHPGMINFFREWCKAKADPTRLVTILAEAQRSMPEGPERSAIAAEIAGHAEEGANAQKAIEQWRAILRGDPTHVGARDALKRLYRQTSSFNHLADLLRGDLDKIPAEDATTRLPLLREIAQIYRESIKSDSALVTVLSQIIALDSTDAAAVRELARVYEALGRWRDLLTTQMRLAELEPDAGTKAELYRAIARRWLEQFSNVQNAVEAYEKLREALPEDREAGEKLRELYTKRRAYRQLFDLLEAESKRMSGAERRATWNEMAKLAAERLDRGADATRIYKLILAEDEADGPALDMLEKQAERDKDFATVAEALEKRADLAADDAARLTILQKLGAVYSDRLQDHVGALKTWRRVLDLSPGHAKALRILRESYLAIGDYDGLHEMYAQQNDWEGLAEVISNTADRTTDVQLKIDLSFRAASIYETKLNAAERAFRSYERVLSVRPEERKAAAALVPLYEREEKWARLPALYEILLAHANDEVEKRALYKKLSVVTGHKLSDKASALKYAKKSFELAPSEPSALAELEQWSKAASDWAPLIEAVEARLAGSEAAPEERRSLRMKLAEVSATQAGRPEDAIAAYRGLIESNPDDEEATAALERLLRSAPDRHDDLRWLFRHRVARALDAKTKSPILAEWALLEEEAFGAADKSAALYREILDLDDKDPRALRALGRLLLASGDAEGAAGILQRERDLEQGTSRVQREIDLARLYLGPLNKPAEALAAAKRALEIAPNDPQVIGVVEDLLPLSATRAAAAVVLEQAYNTTGAWNKQADVLTVLIATAASKSDRLGLFARLADVQQKLGDNVAAFDVVARATEEYPGELELWDRLGLLANKTGRTQQFVEAIAAAVPATGDTGLPPAVEIDLAERAATLFDENLGEIDRATPYLERILRQDPQNQRAFARLKQILTTREKWGDLEMLYERVIQATDDPSRRADLLNEVALVCEEITNEPKKAIGYYERILEIEPANDQAIFALDKLYATEESWQKLANLLERRIALAGGADTTALKLRLGSLLFNRLGDAKAAMNYLEEVVTADSSLFEARELVEKCLGHKELRQRAAIILEGVYQEREEIRDLVRILEVRLEFVTDDVEKRELLRRIAELRDVRLTDDKGAFEAYGKLLPLSPGDVEARQRYLEIALRQTRLDEAADVLLVAAKSAESPQPRAEILGDVAKIYEESEQIDRAEAVHRQVLDLAPEDPSIALPATRALERIYTNRGKHAELADVLRAQVKLEEATEIRRELLARLGTLTEKVLNDDPAAIAAWKQRLEDDPVDDMALEALDRLYERAGDWRNLVETLRVRERQANDTDVRKAFMTRIAETVAEKIGDTDEAILAYRAVLDDFGAEQSVLAALAKLYEKAEKWPDLAETLEAELGVATERVALLTRLGDVRRKRLGDAALALDSYREALTLDPEATAAKTALEELLEDENVRRDVAEVLRPLYEGSNDDQKLLRVLDIQIEHESNLDARLELLAKAASLAEPAPAFGYASRGLTESAGEASLPAWVNRVEELATKTGRWDDLVKLYRDVVPDVTDEEKQLELTLRIAVLARDELKDDTLSIEFFKKALELRPEEARALDALETLYEKNGDHEALLDILKRKTEAAPSDADKRVLLYKQAKVADEKLADRDRSIGFYEQILEVSMDPPAVQQLERLYAGSSRWADLVALHERELGADGTAQARKADLHHALGRIHEKELSEIDRAFDEYEGALAEDAAHAKTIEALEALMLEPAHAARSAAMLESVYLARLDWRKVMKAIEARLVGNEDPDERRQLLRRLAKLHEEQEENYRAALDVTAKLFAEDLAEESTWAELERLARVANAEERLAEIYATELANVTADEPHTARLSYRTGEIYESKQKTLEALTFYRRAYAFAPEDEQNAFRAIDRLLAASVQHEERVTLYRDSLEYRAEPTERVRTLHVIAGIEQNDLSRDEAAVATLRSILEIEETEPVALDALSRLFERGARWRDLADLHRRRAELAALPEEEAKWRLSLAEVLDQKLSEPASAIDEIEALLGLVKSGETYRAAVVALEAMLAREVETARVVELLRPIYEAADDWQKQVDLAKHRFGVAASAHEKVAVLRDTAKLLEDRGHDLDKAFDCLKEAFVLDPDDGDTREELDRVAVATARWDDLADAYEKGIVKIDGVGQRELVEALARLHDKRRDDPRKALAAWERLFQLDETDTRPLDEMDQLATLLSDWPALVRVLGKRAELSSDDEERASLWRRIGEARRDMLDERDGAIEAYEKALDIEPESAWTIDNLIGLYEEKNEPAKLVELYRRRVELCGEDDQELKHTLLVDAAKQYETGLGDRREAIVLLGQALAGKPGDPVVMQRLAGLYDAEKMWPELLDNLREQVAAETDAGKKAILTRRIAKLLATEQNDHEKALEAYRDVLAHGWDAGAVEAVRQIGETKDDLRREAAAVLEPVLRAEGKYDELADVLEMRLRAETDPLDRAATLRQVAEVSESRLGDSTRALTALIRALTDRPDDAGLHEEIERVAQQVGKTGWERYADALGERGSASFEQKLTAELFARLGNISENRLEDLPRAAESYARSAEQGGDDLTILAALERVYAALNDTRALTDVLERRNTIETEPAAKADLYHRLASLQIDALGDKAQGLGTLRLALEQEQGHEKSREAVEALLADEALFEDAFETLEGVYRTTAQGERLGKLFARRVDRAQSVRERTRARLELAKVLENEGNDLNAAQRAIEKALEEDPQEPDTLVEIERLAELNRDWKPAAAALGRALDAAAKDESANNAELWARLGRWRREKLEDFSGAEIAFIKALEGDPENVVLVRSVEELTRAPGRERDRIAVLRRLSKLEGEPEEKRRLGREAAEIAENVLADQRLAEEVLRELVADDENDAWAAEELTRLREATGDHLEVVTLLLKRAEAEIDAEKSVALRHRAADVANDKLNDKPRAISLYEAILEQEPSDERAQQRLRALYAEAEKWTELGKLLSTLVDNAGTAEARATLRLALAKLQEEKFESPRDAIDTLRAILDEDADHEEAAEALGSIFDRGGQDADLAELQMQRVERARARGDSFVELQRMVRLGRIQEERVKDQGAALATYEEILERDPDHRDALEAVARLAEARSAWEKAAAALEKLAESATGATAVALALRLAKAREELNDDAGVEAALKRALAAEPNDAGVRTRLAELYTKTKNWADLASLLVGDADRIEAEHGVYEPPSASANTPAPEHVQEAVKLLKRASHIHLTERHTPEDAVPILERVSKLVPQDREVLMLLVDAYTQAKREREAAGVLERVIASFGNKRTKELAPFHHRLGKTLAALGDKDLALAQLDMAFKIDPGSVEVLRDLGVLALDAGDLDRAQKTFRALLLQKLDASSGISKGEVFCYLGEISMKQGDKVKAVQMLERAIENEPGLARAKTMLAELKG